MRTLLGVALILAGLVAGFYFGFWWAFVGGIVQIIEQVKGPETESLVVGFNLLKILLAGFIGYISAAILIIPGISMMR